MCRLISYNIANLSSKRNFSNFFSYINEFEIFFLFETHVLPEKQIEFSCYFRDYVLHWEDAIKYHRAGRASGGCLFGFKKSIEKKYSLKFVQLLGKTVLQLNLNNDLCFLIPCYLNCTNWLNDFDKLQSVLPGLREHSYCILGDLNARLSDMQTIDNNLLINFPLISTNRKSKDKTIDSRGRKLLEMVENYGGIILNGRLQSDEEGEFTYCGGKGSTVIDYAICSLNFASYLNSFNVPSKIYSDHMPLILELCFTINGNNNIKKKTLQKKIILREKNIERYSSHLCNNSNCDYIYGVENINQKVQVLIDKVIAASTNTGSGRSLDPKTNWYDWQCEKARKKMFRSLNNLRKSNLQTDREIYLDCRSTYYNLCRRKKLLKQENDIVLLNTVRNSKDWWAIANKLKKTNYTINTNLKASEFRFHFKALFAQNYNFQQINWSLPMLVDPILDAPFEMHEIRQVLNNAKNNKAPGKDRISYELYKNAPLCFVEEVLALLNFIYLHHDYPDSFRNSVLVPLFKKGDPSLASNYRGLMLLNTLYKIFTGLILSRINSWIDRFNILNEFQAGFRRGYSTVDHIFTLTNIVKLQFNMNQKLFAFFVDLTNAFDKILRNSLFYKLSSQGLSSNIIQVLQGIYEKNLCQVWDGETLSEAFETREGVRQGCLLSPVLFSLFLNDLHDSLPGGINVAGVNIKVLLYADDLVIISESSDGLQHMINAFFEYCVLWSLTVNLQKSKIMVFRQGPRLSANLKWKYGEHDIDIVNEYKYLGVLLQYNLSFKKHLDEKLSTSKLAINSTWLSYLYNPKINISNKVKIFESAAKTIMQYGSAVWGFKRFDQVEKLFRFFMKKMLFLPQNTPNYMLYLETGSKTQFWFTLRSHFNYILKVLQMPESRLPLILAKEVWNKKIDWFVEWQTLCTVHKVDPIEEFSLRHLKVKFFEILVKIEKVDIVNNIDNARASNFHDLYHSLEYPGCPYFNDNYTAHQISVIMKARGGLLNINARAFRDNTNGLCSICNLDKPENTFHVIGECPIFSYIRCLIYGKRSLSNNEVINILNGENFSKLYEFLCSSLKYRNLIVNEFS